MDENPPLDGGNRESSRFDGGVSIQVGFQKICNRQHQSTGRTISRLAHEYKHCFSFLISRLIVRSVDWSVSQDNFCCSWPVDCFGLQSTGQRHIFFLIFRMIRQSTGKGTSRLVLAVCYFHRLISESKLPSYFIKHLQLFFRVLQSPPLIMNFVLEIRKLNRLTKINFTKQGTSEGVIQTRNYPLIYVTPGFLYF
jgi:hypothetical protein